MEGNLGVVLIVDDDTNICEVIDMYLKSSGYDTRIANDGKAAQDLFAECKPNLVLFSTII